MTKVQQNINTQKVNACYGTVIVSQIDDFIYLFTHDFMINFYLDLV